MLIGPFYHISTLDIVHEKLQFSVWFMQHSFMLAIFGLVSYLIALFSELFWVPGSGGLGNHDISHMAVADLGGVRHAATTTRHSYTLTYQFLTDLQMFD